MPPKKDIWQRYLHKFSKHGKLLESKSDLGLTEEGDPPASTSNQEPPAPNPALTSNV